MKKPKKVILYLSALTLLLCVSCKNERDTYYDRPEWLSAPIYDVLKSSGTFTDYLKCVDRTLYARPLKSSGLYTVFAPNDEAFKAYMIEKNVSSVEELPDSVVSKIVSYSIVYNMYTFDRLSDVLSGGWDTTTCVKKKTTYYEPIHQELLKNNLVWVYDMSNFSVGDNNYKFLPVYLSRVFEKTRSFTQASEDYSVFYPTTYTGQNIQNASILQKDMLAENGVIHEIDKVLEPLPNIEKLLSTSEYSLFSSFLNAKNASGDNFFLNYAYNKSATDYFKQALPTKSIDAVYLKSYSNNIAFGVNNERFAVGVNAEKGGFTLFAPNNQAVQQFYTEKLKDYFPNGIETVSQRAMNYFINAQMVTDLVWPGDYKGFVNSQGEYLNGKGPLGDAFDKTKYNQILPASNGFFYGSSNYIKSRYFETVFTEILFNTKYSFMLHAFEEYFAGSLDEELMKCELNGYTQENYTVLLPSDDLLKADGFDWSWISTSSKFGFTNSNSSSSIGNFDAAARMQRLIKSHIFKRIKNSEINSALTSFQTDASFASAYGGYSYAVNEFGDMIRYSNDKLQMLGNFDDNQWVTVTPYKTFKNGQVFLIDKMLQYSPRKTYPLTAAGYTSQDLWTYILYMTSGTQNTNVALFKNYINACLKGDASNALSGLSPEGTYTIFMPSNTAINTAIANGDLPKLLDVTAVDANGSSTPTAVAARQKATAFILSHIVKGKIFVDDGLTFIMPNKEKLSEEVWPTAYKDVTDNTYLAIRKDGSGNLVVSSQVASTGKFLSQIAKTATVTRGLKHSNYFGTRSVLHEINNYFVYKKPQ